MVITMKRNVKKTIEKRLYHVPSAYNMNADDMREIKAMSTTKDGIIDVASVTIDAFVYGFELGNRAAKKEVKQ